ncbi:solute carrier family 22 member 15-like isoform X2 [Lingula anatina]|uniref:Solute carrier family 22 member 15-like isoform X2 n=3 Tax=Lingula anatina TaxID=7574 RepID=A0A1S3HVA7_LINAN|nr:solute carrier family 22 member 15-like isoform X2 [Lingula anatina]|eukprot:XP_013389975.1 solute carrier family 22 member 15-like isoform X2 [Lingula anatina]
MSGKFEEVLEKVGGIGRRQLAIFAAINLTDFVTAWTIMLPVFTGMIPHWTCPVTGHNLNLTNSTNRINGTSTVGIYNITMADGNSSLVQRDVCQKNATFGICDGIQYVSDFTSVVTEWNLICDLDEISDLITTIQMIGIVFGAFLISHLADMFGRKKVWISVVTLNSMVGFANAFSPYWEMFAAMRFFNGMASGGLLILSFIWPLEFIGTKYRSICGAVSFWQIGTMCLALLAYFVRDWRTLVMVTSLFPGVLFWILYRFLPESPRWLAMNNRLEEAMAILEAIAKTNKKPLPDKDVLQKAVEEDKNIEEKLKKYNFSDLFRTPTSTLHTLVLMFVWFVCTSSYYGLSLNVKHMPGDIYVTTVLLGLVEWPAVLSTTCLNNVIGRRPTMFGYNLIGSLAMLSVIIVHLSGQMESQEILITVLALVGKMGISSAWAVAYLYTAELFPTVVRSIGCGAASIAGRIGGVVAPQFVYLAKVTPVLPFILFSSLGLAAAFTGLLLPETRSKGLSDALPEWSWCGRNRTTGDDDRDDITRHQG